MKHLSLETCIRLRDAGFPQPERAPGQLWYCREDLCVLYRVVPDGILAASLQGPAHYGATNSKDWVYCPTALEIAGLIPDCSIHAATHGVFFVHYVTTGHQTTINPVFELAEIWLSKNSKPI